MTHSSSFHILTFVYTTAVSADQRGVLRPVRDLLPGEVIMMVMVIKMMMVMIMMMMMMQDTFPRECPAVPRPPPPVLCRPRPLGQPEDHECSVPGSRSGGIL